MERLMIASPIQYAISSDGVRIAYVTVGNGPPVVFACNVFGEATGYCEGPPFGELPDRLARLGWRVILYDQRGMGRSDRNVADFTLEARVRDLDAVVGALRLDRFALTGVDHGAATAIAFAVENQSVVSRLVLLSPWASGDRYYRIPALHAALLAEANSEPERRLFANILGSVASGFGDPDYVRHGTELFLRSVPPAVFSAFNAAAARIDIVNLLSRVTTPTLVTHEPAFPFGSFELCQEVAAGIPGSEFLVVRSNSIAGRDHDENVTAIDRFLRAGTETGRTRSSLDQMSVRSPRTAKGLTDRELQVLRHVASGASNKEIATQLGVAVSTVERHLVNLYNKIGARGRADAIAFAVRRGLDTQFR